jgi:hypothetical protein
LAYAVLTSEAFPDVPGAGTGGFIMWLDLALLPAGSRAEVLVTPVFATGETAALGVVVNPLR